MRIKEMMLWEVGNFFLMGCVRRDMMHHVPTDTSHHIPANTSPRHTSNQRWIIILFLTALFTPHLSAQPVEEEFTGPSPEQREKALEHIAKDNRRNFHFVLAKLRMGKDTALAWRQLDSLLTEPTQDMFWTYPATAFYFYGGDLLSDEWRAKFRHVWKTWTPYRGDTENHFLMYYETLYLMAQEWPDLPGSEWFNGKSSEENFREAEEYLNHWIDETVRYGQTEWDSPRYFYFYIAPLLTLYDFAEDTTMAKRCGMMVEYLIADYAAEYLAGNYCGAHSRDGDGSVINPRNAEARSYSEFYWENSSDFILPDLAFAAMSKFRCPDIIRDIAHDRATPYTHYERKRSRAKMRYSEERYTDVYKTTYMTKDYALGSMQGGLQQPIQQHTWDITFASDKPNNTIYALHPYASAYELGMFFPEEPELMEEGILNSKASYGSEDKWIGGSPYETIVQKENILVATYTIPPGTRFGHVDFFFPASTEFMAENAEHWIVAIVGNGMASIHLEQRDSITWIEYPDKPYKRLRLWGNNIRYSVAVGNREVMNEGFSPWLRKEEAKRAKIDTASPTNPDLFNGPHLKSTYESGVLEMTCGGKKRVLDFVEGRIR